VLQTGVLNPATLLGM